MADKAAKSTTDTTSVAQGRFTVQLAADCRKDLEYLGARMTESVREQTRFSVSFSMAQVVEGLIRSRAAEEREAEAKAKANGSGEPGTVATPEALAEPEPAKA